jgi:hypothetical protein
MLWLILYDLKKLILTVLFVPALLFCSAPGSRPDYVIHPDSMSSVLVDLHLTEASVPLRQIYGDSASRTLAYEYEAIFKKHNISREQFDTSMQYYLVNPKKMQRIYQVVLDKLNQIN